MYNLYTGFKAVNCSKSNSFLQCSRSGRPLPGQSERRYLSDDCALFAAEFSASWEAQERLRAGLEAALPALLLLPPPRLARLLLLLPALAAPSAASLHAAFFRPIIGDVLIEHVISTI